MKFFQGLLLGILFNLCIYSMAYAQQQCVCTSGCKIAVWNPAWPASGPSIATSCTVYKGASAIGTGASIAGATLNNAGVCFPADPSTLPPTTMCLVTIPAQPTGTVTVTATVTNAAAESPQSPPFSFVSVSALATILPAPTNQRVVP